MSALPARADAVVIGGGVIGTSIAFHLAEAGVDTVLLERGSLGSGASASTARVIRTYFPLDPYTGQLAVRSLDAYHSFARQTGTPLGLKRIGFLVLFTEQQQIDEFNAVHGGQKAAGVDVGLISAREAVRFNPLLSERGILAAAWSPHAYTVDGLDIVRGYAAAARNHGASLFTHTPVTAIDADNTVHTTKGSIRADAIVCAAGPWARDVASMADVDLPMVPYPIEMLFTDVPPSPHRSLPMTMDAASGLRFRSWKDRLLVAMGVPRPAESREDWLGRISRQLTALCPTLDGIGLHRAWTGDFDASPSNAALIGEYPTRPFLYAAGFSGQGLCQAPAAGEKIRDLLIVK
jgi:sarcosine oxidase subunit beta